MIYARVMNHVDVHYKSKACSLICTNKKGMGAARWD